MVQVYLPMGYPIQSGAEFANVIYQGSVVRLYQIPTDPRSDTQLQNRRFLSDITKTKKNLGLFARGACRAVMGSSWGTVLYQIVKADIESWWSEALAEWDTFQEANQNDWRAASPYQATYDDVGQIYFGLTRVIAQALYFYSGNYWGSALWTETQSAAAATWWAKDLTDALQKGKWNDLDSRIAKFGWTDITHASSYLGEYNTGSNNGDDRIEFYVKCSAFKYGYLAGPTFGTVGIYVDGVLAKSLNQYNATSLPQQEWMITAAFRGLHFVKVMATAGYGTLDFVDVQ